MVRYLAVKLVEFLSQLIDQCVIGSCSFLIHQPDVSSGWALLVPFWRLLRAQEGIRWYECFHHSPLDYYPHISSIVYFSNLEMESEVRTTVLLTKKGINLESAFTV